MKAVDWAFLAVVVSVGLLLFTVIITMILTSESLWLVLGKLGKWVLGGKG